MRVEDMQRVQEVETVEALQQTAMAVRYGDGVNAFWLSHGESKYPVLAILVAGDLADLHYIAYDREAGFRSLGGDLGLDPLADTVFYMRSPGEREFMSNRFVVSVDQAVRAAKDFLACASLPPSVKWFEL